MNLNKMGFAQTHLLFFMIKKSKPKKSIRQLTDASLEKLTLFSLVFRFTGQGRSYKDSYTTINTLCGESQKG